ncbi:MAG: ATP-binding protein [Actinomycetia bacterium]|nr:ATP-binding protein [Actinomycetes bacterium]
MLLTFSVANYRCFAEEVSLDLVSDSLKTLTPRSGSWAEATRRLAAVYGANASGKSTLVNAIESVVAAIHGHRGVLHQPFFMDAKHRTAPTCYTVDFTHDEERYRYHIQAHAWGVAREELWVAGTRWRKLFIRTQEPEDERPTIGAGSSLRGATSEVRQITTAQDLFLAVALRYRHQGLAPIARGLHSIRAIHHDDEERWSRLRWLTRRIADNPSWWESATEAIAQTADLGIQRVVLEERDVPPEVLTQIRHLLSAPDAEEVEIPSDLLRDLQQSLGFVHAGTDDTEVELGLGAQSQGTLTWLATVGPAIDALQGGLVLLVDELDASLHPGLTGALVDLFTDETVNRHGAQLVFTTHDTSLLDNSPQQRLASQDVWFTEKSPDGRSELFSLADFTEVRRGTNKQRRYLVGAFGGVPTVDTTPIRRLLSTDPRTADVAS